MHVLVRPYALKGFFHYSSNCYSYELIREPLTSARYLTYRHAQYSIEPNFYLPEHPDGPQFGMTGGVGGITKT